MALSVDDDGLFTYKYQSIVNGEIYELQMLFPNQETAFNWQREVEELKTLSSQSGSRPITEEEHQSMARNWLEQALQFHKKWGSLKVPDDVRQSIHETECFLGLPLTPF